MHNIKTVSFYFRVLFQILFVVLPIITLLLWLKAPAPFEPGMGILMRVIPESIQVLHPLNVSTKIFGFLITMIPTLVFEFILYFLIKLFRLYERGEIFTSNNVRYIKYTGYALLIGQLLNPVYQALLTAILTLQNPPGQRIMSISISGTDVGIILVALLIILISWIMAEGCRLQEEQEYTV